MKYARHRPELPYVCILASEDGSRRFRASLIAEDVRRAREKAERITADILGIEIELVCAAGFDGADPKISSGSESWDGIC